MGIIALPKPKKIYLPSFNRIKKVSWSDFFEIQSEELVFLQVKPDVTVDNGSKIEQITKSVHSLLVPFEQRISFLKPFKIVYKKQDDISYAVLFNEGKITFHFAVPKRWQNFFTQRIYSVWNNCTITHTEKDYLDLFTKKESVEYHMGLTNGYYTSINYDYRKNHFVPSLMSVINDMTNDDKALFEVIMHPIEGFWKNEATANLKKFIRGEMNPDLSKGLMGMIGHQVFSFLDGFFKIFDTAMDLDVKEEKDKDKSKVGLFKHVTPATRNKAKHDGFKTHIRIISQSKDEVRRVQVAEALTVPLSELNEDNEFKVTKKIDHTKKKTNGKGQPIMKLKINGQAFEMDDDDSDISTVKDESVKITKVKPKADFNRNIPLHAKDNILNTKEVGQMLQMPVKHLQDTYKEKIENISLTEMNVPAQMFQDGIPIGYVKYKGVERLASWNTKDKDVRALPIAEFGMQGSGKTKLLANHIVNASKKGQSSFILDGIKDCELSVEARDFLPEDFPEDKIIELDFSDLENIIPLAWNEVSMKKIKKNSDKFKMANHITQQLMFFLDSLALEQQQKLSPRMRRYLSSAGLLVFSQENTTIMDCMNVLADFNIRHDFIERSGLSSNNKIIQDLLSLDTDDGGTREGEIRGIIDRMDWISGDYVLNALFSARGNNKINFTKWANEGYVVFCKMPQTSLSDTTINILTTFLMSKIWLAILMRGDNKADYSNYNLCNVFVDEIHRIPLASKMLDNIREQRKYGLKYIFSAHQPKDFKALLKTLQSAGCSYVLFNTSKDNWKIFEDELKPFTIEDCMKTKKYHAKVIANFDKEYCVFDAKIIPPLDITSKRIDRSHLSQICAEEYGVQLELE